MMNDGKKYIALFVCVWIALQNVLSAPVQCSYVTEELQQDTCSLLLSGMEGKTWSWYKRESGDEKGFCWGIMGYLASAKEMISCDSSFWWGLPFSSIQEAPVAFEIESEDVTGTSQMTFMPDGTMFKSGGGTGEYEVLTHTAESPYRATLIVKGCGILFPYQFYTGCRIDTFEIYRLTDEELILSHCGTPTFHGSAATFWRFTAEDIVAPAPQRLIKGVTSVLDLKASGNISYKNGVLDIYGFRPFSSVTIYNSLGIAIIKSTLDSNGNKSINLKHQIPGVYVASAESVSYRFLIE